MRSKFDCHKCLLIQFERNILLEKTESIGKKFNETIVQEKPIEFKPNTHDMNLKLKCVQNLNNRHDLN